MKNGLEKSFVPVGEFERQTSYCPTHIAWQVLDEAQAYFRQPIPAAYADKLAARAELAFAGNMLWKSKLQGRHTRAWLMSFMRHWLSSVLAREKPSLHRQLPESFLIGQSLTSDSVPPPFSSLVPRKTRRNLAAARPMRLVHGCELLMM